MIVYENYVIQYLNELVSNLYLEEYFGFIESSEKFVDKITAFITENISTFPARKTPFQLKNYGSNYIFYKSNQRTTWYIFFDKEENIYLITNIINNNSEEVKWL